MEESERSEFILGEVSLEEGKVVMRQVTFEFVYEASLLIPT
jgi:hypothetical protein